MFTAARKFYDGSSGALGAYTKQLRQLGDICRDPPRLVAGELPFCPRSFFTPVEDPR